MATEVQVRESLGEILVPGVKRSLAVMNLVRKVVVSDHGVDITLASTALNESARDWIAAKAKTVVGKLTDVDGVDVGFVEAKPGELNQVKNIIAIMSGKGGVGKSLVAGLVAVGLRRQGSEVGILDADITGPSIPKMFGINERPAGSDTGFMPVLSRSGIEVMSINLLLPQEDESVLWRGPLISRAVTQFWQEVLWGKLDYLVVDLPPGTADVPLTVMQTIPVSGIVIVFTPQDLTTMIVKKAIRMAKKMGKPIIGVVENMSYLYVPEIDKRIELFGKGKGREMTQAAGAPLLAQLPIDPELARLCDEGNIERYDSDVLTSLRKALTKALPLTEGKE
ncbi:MAG: Mrp/NBP35 family ATP-binding protein [Dehalococcoidales bacterium]|nr:Mrp/NBP35 family ATP-binding protein [Dehalococcoidales bacterium]